MAAGVYGAAGHLESGEPLGATDIESIVRRSLVL
jgi:hypothetical protein